MMDRLRLCYAGSGNISWKTFKISATYRAQDQDELTSFKVVIPNFTRKIFSKDTSRLRMEEEFSKIVIVNFTRKTCWFSC